MKLSVLRCTCSDIISQPYRQNENFTITRITGLIYFNNCLDRDRHDFIIDNQRETTSWNKADAFRKAFANYRR